MIAHLHLASSSLSIIIYGEVCGGYPLLKDGPAGVG
jgi:hypothetical protein